ncbi:PREDICTED: beta-D-glucosyl crocetin beta-1,6-glucosyltransferase-like [Ipomoea nil]|uniref:beta-D-glucosyl crocetin beta-1,6-glucosyltransferase-like n=1 Tax=Ipomoea nil TaxID=35883 RepID=UPI0009013F25|nr:PREDICTED: beta-D-glucosyl crocetin beta-1,6-glucosyltransferase-like [Ipomoea nil]
MTLPYIHNHSHNKDRSSNLSFIMDEKNRLRVLMFPWLAVGHISPFFELAKKLADRGFCIHICSTPINLSFIKNKIPSQYSSSIQLVDLHLPESPELPPHYHTTNGLPLHLNFTLQKTLKMAKPTFSTIMESLKPNLLIYDILMPWAAGVADSHNVPAVRFFTSGAAVCTYFIHMFKRPNAEYPFPELYLRRYEQERAQKLMDERRSGRKDAGGAAAEDDGSDSAGIFHKNMVVISSSTEIERKYVDYLRELLSCKVLTLGTLVKPPMKMADEFSELMGWLGEKEEKSTVFASFGSEYFLSKEDMEEVAYGLEQSQANFIWVVRFPKGNENPNLEEALPKGFLERIGGRGRVVEGWAPQEKILSHQNTGGFMSHCGWNSLVESIEYGVPIIAMPMHLDQPVNAKLMVAIGVGVEVLRDDGGKLHREDVGRVVKDVIKGKLGENVRNNVKIVGENVKLKSIQEMDEAAVVLAQLCDV